MNIYEDENNNNSIEKEINFTKENDSFLIKSIEETEFNFIDLIKNKPYLSINLNISKNNFQIQNKSIFKIFNLFTNINIGENLENNLTDYITCTILDLEEDNNSYNKEITANSLEVLDTPYKKLLEQTKKYKINIINSRIEEIKKELLNYDNQNNKIDLDSKSIERISRYLNKTKYDISDFINILVLYNEDNDDYQDIIKRKLIDKYDNIGQNIYFMGIKDFSTDLKIPIKCNKNPIYRINAIFNNILNKIDNIENNYSSDENNDKNNDNNLKENILNHSKKFNEFNIKSEIYNKNNDNNVYQITDENEKKEGCQKEFCPNCNIF